jgi:hypothetical protein
VNGDLPELERLGRVGPPASGVLDAAREVLWSAVAAEMLATAPPDAADAGTARADTPHADAAHAGGEPVAGRNAEEPAREPRRADPGPS